MKPSFFGSTLALAFILCLLSLFVLIITAIVVAIWYPEAYKVMSDEKTAFMVLTTLYFSFVGQVIGAYLSARTPNTKED